jgi:hypothetical protein
MQCKTVIPDLAEVCSEIYFLKENALFATEKPFAFRYDVGDQEVPQTNMEMQPHPCVLRNMRGAENQFSLEKQGFEVLQLGEIISYECFFDDQAVQPYFRKLEDLVKRRLNASQVQVFRHGVSSPVCWDSHISLSLSLEPLTSACKIRKRHMDFPISTGEKYSFDQPTSVAHIGKPPC